MSLRGFEPRTPAYLTFWISEQCSSQAELQAREKFNKEKHLNVFTNLFKPNFSS